MKKKNTYPVPSIITDLENKSLAEFCKILGFEKIVFSYYKNAVYKICKDGIYAKAITSEDVNPCDMRKLEITCFRVHGGRGKDKLLCGTTLIFLDADNDGVVWKCEVVYDIPGDSVLEHTSRPRYSEDGEYIGTVTTQIGQHLLDLSEIHYTLSNVEYYTEPFAHKPRGYRPVYGQNEEIIGEIISKFNPYGYKWFSSTERGYDPATFYLAPQLEQLIKCGYGFAEYFAYGRFNEAGMKKFNLLTKREKSIPLIFSCSKAMYTGLTNITDIDVWDSMRKLEKSVNISADTVVQMVDSNIFCSRNIKNLSSVLKRTWEGKPVFTFNTLVAYLNRIDANEAITNDEGLQLIADYLMMCQQLGKKPVVDGDSLKREHDVTARLCTLYRNEDTSKKIEEVCKKNSALEFSSGKYFIRCIKDQDDLIHEANMQGNCVASYANSIAAGRTKIFVMRNISNPEQSLITVELSPDNKCIRQAYLSHNRLIENNSQMEFLRKWLEYIGGEQLPYYFPAA